MIINLGTMERVNVRAAWPNEAAHFTPWLASEQGLELLQDALGIDLEVEAVEQSIGPFRADILAKRQDTPDEHWVLIENQLEKTDHRHLGQLLTYAAGLKAATIVWVAQDFAEEHRAALDWLNEITSDAYQFFGLQIELWKIGASEPAPMFNVLAEPNDWSREVKQSAENTVSELKEQQQRFWQGVRARLLEKKSYVRPQKAHPQHWADYALGRAGTWLSATMNTAKAYVSVEFNFRGPPDKTWFKELEAKRDQIEASVGPGLVWKRLDGKKSSRVGIYLEGQDPTNEKQWSMQQAWLVEKLELFHRVFSPMAKDFSGDSPNVSEAMESDEPELD